MAKTKVAILGGGIGSLAAAFDITEQDPTGARFEVTLHQMGWRLGGKCAVGWMDGPPRVRVEHGLHVWAGFYDNAFDLLQRCYGAMTLPPYPNWRDAFEPIDNFWVEDSILGALEPWRLHVPPNGRTPGLGWVESPRQLWTGLLNSVSNAYFASPVRGAALRRAREKRLTANPSSSERLRSAQKRLEAGGFGLEPKERASLSDLLASTQEELIPEAFDGAPSSELHGAIFVNLGMALLLGILDGGVLSQGFDVLDGQEWSEWMNAYGAWPRSLSSAVVVGLYAYVFGYRTNPDGSVKNRCVGAGTGTRALLRLLFAYKGSLFYAPERPFGEILIAPLYKVLRDRGVNFEFFHRVDRLVLSPDKRTVDEIEIGIQARPLGEPYDPLISVGGADSWPETPYSLIKDGATLEKSGVDLESPSDKRFQVGNITRRRGRDFDVVVLGISVGALKNVCADLADRLPAWRDMLGGVETTATVAMQLWLKKSVADYGWRQSPPSPPTLVSALPVPLTTWGDNSLFKDQEPWPGDKPSSLAYFVGNFPDTADAADATRWAKTWRDASLTKIWRAYDDSQLAIEPYVRINVHPSDRYVQSVPGSVGLRLSPNGSGVDNLFLAGDWVRIGLNAGCVEQAVLGGRAAARAITGVDMNSQYDNDYWSGNGLDASSVAALGLLSLLPNFHRVAYAGAGNADVSCVVAHLPRDVVENYLPLGLRLGKPLQGCMIDTWPVAIMFAQQSGVRPGLAPPIGGLKYNEYLLVVPNVFHTERQPFQGPFCYMPEILLNSLPAQVIGAGLYGLKKHLARIRAYPDSFDVRYDGGEIRAEIRHYGLAGRI